MYGVGLWIFNHLLLLRILLLFPHSNLRGPKKCRMILTVVENCGAVAFVFLQVSSSDITSRFFFTEILARLKLS